MTDIETRLAELAGLTRGSELLARRAQELDTRLAEQTTELTTLREQHADEVEDIDSMSISRVLAALRGDTESHVAREQAEADAAGYRVAQAQSRLAALHAERQVVAGRLHALSGLPARYAAVLDEKDSYVRGTRGPGAARLMVLAQERGRAEAELRELGEATAAADVALGALTEVRRQLERVSDLQAANNWTGGATLLNKPGWVDAAAWAAVHADRCLAVLHTELADVGLARPLGHAYAVVQPIGVLNGFLENYFTRNSVRRERINHARRSVDKSAGLVAEVRRETTERYGLVRTRWTTIMRERHALLTGTQSS
ncbi:hypothetical protein GCM10010435_76390 [Winogradskya consettensis]|uniref:Uncharacterized protein n=1 Tax=Winogradskya consettensis TaxID=113560 RepID=A0A919VQ40_9ACTN|nr:hypothetical protein [Actinoplanes consettensis]GIM74499.1 hypothetical protein Aco04nite_40600 [Actinoplanes consettensis]